MTLTEEQAKQIKKQLLEQISHFPPEQRKAAEKQITTMNARELEQFLIKNKLLRESSEIGETEDIETESSACLFCSIAQGKTSSYKLDENANALAVLDINPLSRGQSLVVPKKHETIEKLPSSVLALAKKIAKKIKSKLKAEEIKIETSSVQGHGIISIIPLYKNQKLERKKAPEQELRALQEKLAAKKRAPRKKKQAQENEKEKISKLPLAPRRVP